MNPRITLYTKGYCPFCHRAKALLDSKSAAYEEFDITSSPDLRAEMIQRSGRMTVPQIFIGGRHIGGSDDLTSLERAGKLDALLKHREFA